MSGADAAMERLAIKAERIALARAETLTREHRTDRAGAQLSPAPVALDH